MACNSAICGRNSRAAQIGNLLVAGPGVGSPTGSRQTFFWHIGFLELGVSLVLGSLEFKAFGKRAWGL
jgi:hypothetical protein